MAAALLAFITGATAGRAPRWAGTGNAAGTMRSSRQSRQAGVKAIFTAVRLHGSFAASGDTAYTESFRRRDADDQHGTPARVSRSFSIDACGLCRPACWSFRRDIAAALAAGQSLSRLTWRWRSPTPRDDWRSVSDVCTCHGDTAWREAGIFTIDVSLHSTFASVGQKSAMARFLKIMMLSAVVKS